MTNQEIFELMDRFERSGLAGMKLSMENSGDRFKIELSRCAAGTMGGVVASGKAAWMSGTAAGGAGVQGDVGVQGDIGVQGGAETQCNFAQAAGVAAADGTSLQTAAGGSAASGEGAKSGLFITAPMVGTYYAASDPKQPPFVMPGDRVFKGQTVCLMEAMKMISEIPAPCDCIIEEILKADGDLAAFGEPLFRYQPC